MFKGRKNKKLFEEYIEKNSPKLYRLAFIYVKNKEDALDVVQDSVIKGYKAIEKLKDIETLEKWFNRIVINTSLDFLRKQGKITLIESDLKEEGKNDNSDLIVSVEDLPEDVKGIIILKYFHGYSINEIGEILELPISKVKNRLHKGLNLLRKEFKEGSYE